MVQLKYLPKYGKCSILLVISEFSNFKQNYTKYYSGMKASAKDFQNKNLTQLMYKLQIIKVSYSSSYVKPFKP